MRMISWNVNGLRAVLKKGFEDIVGEFDADVVALQETKLQAGQATLDLPRYREFWSYAERKGYSGTAVFTKEKPLQVLHGLGFSHLDNEGRIVACEFPEFWFVCVYTPNAQNELARIDHRMEWDDAFRDFCIDRLAKLPIVNTVLGRGYDVLLCTKDVDEFCFQSMMNYGPEPEKDAEGKNIEGTGPKELKNVASGDLDFATEDEKKEAEAAEKDNEALLKAMKEHLGDAVTKVAVSTRLTDAPSAVTTEGPVSLEMERLMSQMPEGMGEVKSQRVLELNAKHPVFEVLKGAQEAGDADKVNLYTDILYNQALIVEGMPIADPVAYANAVTKLMA